MLKRSVFGFRLPKISYDRLGGTVQAPIEVPRSATIRLRAAIPLDRLDRVPLKIGTRVRTGQRLLLREDASAAVVATATGTVGAIGGGLGPFGQPYTEVSIDCVQGGDEFDGAFGELAPTPSLAAARDYLCQVPGALPLAALRGKDCAIKTIVVNGVEPDLCCLTAQFTLRHRSGEIAAGVAILKQIAQAERVVLVVAHESMQNYGHLGAQVLSVPSTYPSGIPRLVIKAALGEELALDSDPAERGVLLMGVEAAASIGQAFQTGQVPLHKIVTLLDAKGAQTLVRARIGTPVGDLLATHGIALADRDRLIVGGPMTGQAIHSALQPVLADTDMVMVQAAADLERYGDYACINCGECIRICPARIPVNMLVRFLEARAYAAAADEYDLNSCIECGLCTWVCVARIPIFQHIMLAKHELAQEQAQAAAEVVHD